MSLVEGGGGSVGTAVPRPVPSCRPPHCLPQPQPAPPPAPPAALRTRGPPRSSQSPPLLFATRPPPAAASMAAGCRAAPTPRSMPTGLPRRRRCSGVPGPGGRGGGLGGAAGARAHLLPALLAATAAAARAAPAVAEPGDVGGGVARYADERLTSAEGQTGSADWQPAGGGRGRAGTRPLPGAAPGLRERPSSARGGGSGEGRRGGVEQPRTAAPVTLRAPEPIALGDPAP